MKKKNSIMLILTALILISANAIAAVPSITNFNIANNADFTNTEKPILHIEATNATTMAFSCLAEGPFTPEIFYALEYNDFDITNSAFGCPAGEGPKTVFAKVFSADGSDTKNDSITLDKTKPNTIDDYAGGTDWQNADQIIILTPDAGDISGLEWTKHCIDTTDTCDPSTGTTGNSATISTEGTSYFRYASKDNAGNIQNTVSKTVKIDKTAPNTSSTVAAGWYKEDKNLGFACSDTGNGQSMASGCAGTRYRINLGDWTNYNPAGISLTAPANEARSHAIDFNSVDNIGNEEATKSVTISIDKNAPAITSFSATIGSNWTNNANPTFSISATDTNSGVSAMRFSCSNSDNNSDWSTEASYTTTYSDFNITNGAANCSNSDGTKNIYLQVKDSAGNWSASSQATTVNYDRTEPNTPSAPSIALGSEQVTVSWGTVNDSIVNGSSSGLREYRVYRDGSVYATVSSSTNSQAVTGLTNGTEYRFKVGAVDNAGNESISSESTGIPRASTTTGTLPGQDDASIPSVAIINPATNATVSGIVTLEARAIDSGTGINFVTFELPDKNYVTASYPATGSIYNGTWQIQWFTFGLQNNKEYTVRAMAKDKGNPVNNSSSWDSETFRIDNTVALADLDKNNAKDAIGNAENKKESLEEQVKEAALFGLSAQSLEEKTIADDLLEEAKARYAQKKYLEAAQKAEDSAEKYLELSDSLSISSYGEKQAYAFSPEKAQIFLKAAGLNEQLADEYTALMQESDLERNFEIKQIKEGNSTRYKAVVSITVTNSSTESMELKIIEVIPKEFAENSDLIVSGESMNVIEADPKIEFLVSISAGKTKTISYALKNDLTRQEADDLLASNPLDFFVAPPIVLNAATETTISAAGSPTGFLPLGFIGENAGLIGIVLLVIAIIALSAFFILRKMGEEERNQLSWDDGKMDLFKSLKKKIGEEKKPMKTGKWGYKGE